MTANIDKPACWALLGVYLSLRAIRTEFVILVSMRPRGRPCETYATTEVSEHFADGWTIGPAEGKSNGAATDLVKMNT